MAYGDFFDDGRPLHSQALRAEFATKMVCDLLHNEDTMSMAHSVESRVPLLDLDLVRFAARIPDDIRFGAGPKGLLKEALAPVLPACVLQKRKWGFTFDPVEQYRKDLGPMVRETPDPRPTAPIRHLQSRLRASGREFRASSTTSLALFPAVADDRRGNLAHDLRTRHIPAS